MSDTYTGDKILARQRVCSKCRSFITLDRVNENQFACTLCGQRLNAYVNNQGHISIQEIRALVKAQHDAHHARHKAG